MFLFLASNSVDRLCMDFFENGFPEVLDQIFTLIGQGFCFGWCIVAHLKLALSYRFNVKKEQIQFHKNPCPYNTNEMPKP